MLLLITTPLTSRVSTARKTKKNPQVFFCVRLTSTCSRLRLADTYRTHISETGNFRFLHLHLLRNNAGTVSDYQKGARVRLNNEVYGRRASRSSAIKTIDARAREKAFSIRREGCKCGSWARASENTMAFREKAAVNTSIIASLRECFGCKGLCEGGGDVGPMGEGK